MGRCRKCGCTDHDCTGCVERTGRPCHWVEPDLCSACTPRFKVGDLVVAARVGNRLKLPHLWTYVVCRPGGDPEEMPGQPGWSPLAPVELVELHLPPDLWAVARRVLPALAKKGLLTL